MCHLLPLPARPAPPRRRNTLRILGTVGEPINPEAWRWYYEVVGNSNVSVVDTWWQTETGAHMITPLPGATPMKPGSGALLLGWAGLGWLLACLSARGLGGLGEGVWELPGPARTRQQQLAAGPLTPPLTLPAPLPSPPHPPQPRCPSLAWSPPSWTTRATRWRGPARGERC